MSVAGQQTTASLGSAARGPAASWYQPLGNSPFNIFITGTFVATVALIRSPDAGATWTPIALPSLLGPTTFTVPDSLVAQEPDAAVLWAASCLPADGGAWTSGAAVVRFG